jgi:hypothetical protein
MATARFNIRHKVTASVFLVAFSTQTFFPMAAYAITSGPTTPEMTSFTPASMDNMVDLFSGDFSYNIPLLDVGGYPVNLAYHAGTTPEDEASWVGMGWSLNPGAINRQLRGIPDDFDGDQITEISNKKPNVTVGGNVNVALKWFGQRLPKIKLGRKKKKNAGMGKLKVKIGIQYNNYTGYKGMIGIGTGFGTSDDNSGLGVQDLGPKSSLDGSANFGLNADNQSGINPYASFEVNYKIRSEKEREAERKVREAEAGMKDVQQSKEASGLTPEQKSENLRKVRADLGGASFGASSSIDFNGYQPPGAVSTPMISKNFTASLSLGPSVFNADIDLGIEGTYSSQELKDAVNSAPAYGFMNSAKAKSNEDALLDYNVEKESPYLKRLPNLGVTVSTPDLYNVTSNAGSMQFRSYLRGAGVFYHPYKHDVDKSTDLGLEPAFGNVFHIGVPLQLNRTNNKSGKWKHYNNYIDVANFKPEIKGNADGRAAYFKRVGEKSRQDGKYFNDIGFTTPVAVRLTDGWAFGTGKATELMRKKNQGNINGDDYARDHADKVNHTITPLRADEAQWYALDKTINDYYEGKMPTDANAVRTYIPRNSDYHKAHHISQFTITQDDGQRMVYGIPVYNRNQEEVSFAIRHDDQMQNDGIAIYSPGDNTVGNRRGKDYYYHKSITPSYTTGHLLSAILSPDYVDMKGDGVTDDDQGSAVKFNYSRSTDNYKWRTPYVNDHNNENTANYNRGYNSVQDDDKGNYSWGTKELWYLHSIESKTMVAKFVTEGRSDGAGVANENGGKDGSAVLKKLVEIRLYSKSDLYANSTNAIPVKVVHFEYYDDDELMTNVPNNLTGKGKLTLKSVWFSYGTNNTKGSLHKYVFKYNKPEDPNYKINQLDRWGNYKPETSNPHNLNNTDFPYATQNKDDANAFAAAFQLSEIKLPSGGVITVKYESDDYAYVQDRKATQMCFLTGIGDPGKNNNFSGTDRIYVNLPTPVKDRNELEQRYLRGLRSLAFQTWVKLDNKEAWEFVSGYAEITGWEYVSERVALVKVGTIGGYNPIAKAAWQKLKLEVPRYAYPEYDNLDAEGSGFIKAIKALGATFGRFKDLVESFDSRAVRKHFGDELDLNKSWVRLNTPSGDLVDPTNQDTRVNGKFGGGHRVQEIRISDEWSQMSGVATAQTGSYGQAYEYTETVAGVDGPETISSGVASYEPLAGGDENPFREPINYTDKHFFGRPKHFYLEKPMGESYFPGATVGYSKVTVKNIGADGSKGATGTSVSEFYTAKDFPTKTSELPMERKQPKLNWLPRLFGAKITSGVTVSQGYVVENNDMHGKQKKESVYGANGSEISSNRYFYKVENAGAEKPDLKNSVDVVNANRAIEKDQIVGMDIDMFTEMTENSMENVGVSVDPSFSFSMWGIIPIPSVTMALPKANYEKRLYRGSTTIKLVNRFGILDKVVKTVNGSTSTTENLLWDAETGEVLLTKTNNEFDDPIYTFNYPAHWVYDGMGSAFRNEGIYLDNVNVSGGSIGTYGILTPGDELADLVSDHHYWITDVTNGASTQKLALIDKDGNIAPLVVNGSFKIIRSGRRNLAAASVGSVVSMVNPVQAMPAINPVAPYLAINFSVAEKILQANAVEYSEYWPMPVNSVSKNVNYIPNDCTWTQNPITQSYSYTCTCNCLSDFIYYLINTKQLFLTRSDNVTVGTLINNAIANNFPIAPCDLLNRNLDKPFYALTTDYVGLVYSAQVGDCKISIRSNTGQPISFTSLEKEVCTGSSVATFSEKRQVIYGASCNLVVGNLGGQNRDRLVTGVYLNNTSQYTWFTIPGVSLIPQNATITFARLTLYAHPGGYDPQNGITDALMPGPGDRMWIGPFSNSPSVPNFNCIDPNFTPNGIEGGYIPAISNPFETVQVDMPQAIQSCVTFQYNKGFGLISTKYPANPQYFATFCSNFYSDSTKHPKLQVSYTIPNQATAQIDECKGTTCENPSVNPYTTGILGNWRAKKQSVYDTKRVRNQLNPTVAGTAATHLRNSGYFLQFTPFNWVVPYNPNNTSNPGWQWTAEVQKFSLKGQEIENKDALERFSSAQYGYLGSVPVAVGANARQREIGFDGFEDYKFKLTSASSTSGDCDIKDHFSLRTILGASGTLDDTKAHSGNYSVKLSGTITMNKPILDNEPDKIYGVDGQNQHYITNPYLRFGFQPRPGKKYILSGWVYDGASTSANINGFNLNICGYVYDVNANATNPLISKVYVVEGWKRFEIVFTTPTSGEFTLQLGGTNINIDDLRIHPYDGQLKSFVYDARSMRLMAELDENNFATFYEYDEEGTLIRVKKETEKGINTIKETRSSLRKQ